MSGVGLQSMDAQGTVPSLTRKAEMGADSWSTLLVRVREKIAPGTQLVEPRA